MYQLRKVLRYRLSRFIVEAIESGHKGEVKLLDKYEAIISEELKQYMKTLISAVPVSPYSSKF
jgi:hypothetical protein